MDKEFSYEKKLIEGEYESVVIKNNGSAEGLEECGGFHCYIESKHDYTIDETYKEPRVYEKELGPDYIEKYYKNKYYISYCPFCKYPEIEKPKYFRVYFKAYTKGDTYKRILYTECPDCHNQIELHQTRVWKRKNKSPSVVPDKET